MKKKLVSVLLALTMVSALFAGCSKKEKETTATEPTTAASSDAAEVTEPAAEPVADTGKVLNIWCWNPDVQTGVFNKYLPGYTDNGDGTGTMGDVKVNWVVTPSANLAYQDALDAALLDQANAAADDKIDMFLIEADYALKYTNAATPVAMSMDELGITADDLKDQYQYTKDVCTDANGALRGVSYQACPGLFAYRRSIAKDVLGTDDPAEVQKKLADWDSFNTVAADMKTKGYTMLSGYDDSFRTFSSNMSAPWVTDGKVKVDDMIMQWVDQTKTYTDKGYNNKTTLWAPEWTADQTPAGKTFGFFYSTWGINFTLAGNSRKDTDADAGPGNGIWGDWAVCEGPAPYSWGGTWFCAAVGTDNPNLVKQIILDLTCNKDNMKKITEGSQDYTNNMAAMDEIANSDFKSDFLGGQNHIKLFNEAAKKISMKLITIYDQGCNEQIQTAMHDYFNGNVTKDEALANFKKNIVVRYPELTAE